MSLASVGAKFGCVVVILASAYLFVTGDLSKALMLLGASMALTGWFVAVASGDHWAGAAILIVGLLVFAAH